jgi:N-acetyl-alpha-D-muramate 1-phosphate uridylyltransferase
MTTSAPVAILAGGLATRLRPITEKIPKALVPVAARPFLEHQLEYLRGQGIDRIVLCVGYLGEMIRDQYGDGAGWGVRIDYSFDGPALLGTAGALKQAMPLLGEKFFVLYGDSYLPIDFRKVAEAFDRAEKLGLMTVFRNEGRWDTSNVWFEDSRIRLYDKKERRPEMQFIDYGLSMFRAEAFDRVPAESVYDLANLMKELVEAGELAGFEAEQRFYEIGSPAGLNELDDYLRRKQ